MATGKVNYFDGANPSYKQLARTLPGQSTYMKLWNRPEAQIAAVFVKQVAGIIVSGDLPEGWKQEALYYDIHFIKTHVDPSRRALAALGAVINAMPEHLQCRVNPGYNSALGVYYCDVTLVRFPNVYLKRGGLSRCK